MLFKKTFFLNIQYFNCYILANLAYMLLYIIMIGVTSISGARPLNCYRFFHFYNGRTTIQQFKYFLKIWFSNYFWSNNVDHLFSLNFLYLIKCKFLLRAMISSYTPNSLSCYTDPESVWNLNKLWNFNK